MKNKYYKLLSSVFLMFVVFGLSSGNNVANAQGLNNFTTEIESFEWTQTLSIAVVFVNYDMNLVDTNYLQYTLPGYLWSYDGFQYNIDYTFLDATEEYEEELLDFVYEIANFEDTTSDVDFVALNEQAIDGHVRDIFIEQQGTSISAEMMEEWFHDNPYESEADYRYYALNFSEFDTVDHSREHWFTVDEIDPDTGIQRHWWRNEWDFPTNFDAKFPYPGYSQKYADYFFDPFMFQWYTKWNQEWFGLGPYREYYSQDLDSYLQNGGYATIYIQQWLVDIILMHNDGSIPSYGNSMSIELVVLQNVTHLGYTNEDLKWVVNEEYTIAQFNELNPSADVTLDVKFENWLDYPELNEIFQYNTWDTDIYYSSDPPIPDYNYYDGFTLWDYLWSDPIADQFFTPSTSEVVVKGYAFILDNATFSLPGLWAGGGLYTGLGGGGRMIQLMELDRLYYPDRITPRQGFSRVVIHEAGHAVGLGHTFGGPYVASDFIGDVMGYYPGVVKFSKVRTEAFQRHAANRKAVLDINPLLFPFVHTPELYKTRDLLLINLYQKVFYFLRENHHYAAAYDLLDVLEDYLSSIQLKNQKSIHQPDFNSSYRIYLMKLMSNYKIK